MQATGTKSTGTLVSESARSILKKSGRMLGPVISEGIFLRPLFLLNTDFNLPLQILSAEFFDFLFCYRNIFFVFRFCFLDEVRVPYLSSVHARTFLCNFVPGFSVLHNPRPERICRTLERSCAVCRASVVP